MNRISIESKIAIDSYQMILFKTLPSELLFSACGWEWPVPIGASPSGIVDVEKVTSARDAIKASMWSRLMQNII